MSKYNREQVRKRFLERKKLVAELGLSLPGLEDLDGEIGIMELSATDIEDIEKLSQVNGESNDKLEAAATLVKGLVMLDSRDHVFDERELNLVAGFGLSLLTPINMLIRGISGITEEQREAIKAQLKKIRGDSSNSTSTAPSEAEPAA